MSDLDYDEAKAEIERRVALSRPTNEEARLRLQVALWKLGFFILGGIMAYRAAKAD